MACLFKHLFTISVWLVVLQANKNTKFTVDAKENEGAEQHETAAAICGKTELEKLVKLEVSNAELWQSLAQAQMLVLELRRGYVDYLQANLELNQTDVLTTRLSVLEERFEKVEGQVKALVEQWKEEKKKNEEESDASGRTVALLVSQANIPTTFNPTDVSDFSLSTNPTPPSGPSTHRSLSPEERDELGRSLIQATKEGKTNDVRHRLEQGAYAHYVDGTGNTALHYASWSGHLQIVKLLLKAGAPVNAANDGWTPLHSATHQGQQTVVRELILAGADVNARDKEGSTPLHVAAYSDQLPIIQTLLFAGAKPEMQNNLGKTPYDSAWNDQAKALLSLV